MARQRFSQQACCDLQLWVTAVGLLQLFRAVLILAFRSELSSEVGAEDFLRAAWTGFRFDAQVASWFTLPSFCGSVGCLYREDVAVANRLRAILRGLLVIGVIAVGAIDLGYFSEYHDQFNHFLFGAVYDDSLAVIVTIAKQYPVVSGAIGAVLVTAVIWPIARRLTMRPWLSERATSWLSEGRTRQAAFVAICLALMIVSVRGSAGRRPVQHKDAAATRDLALNKMVLNPFAALRYAVTEHRRLNGGRGLEVYLKDGDVRRAALVVADDSELLEDVDAVLRRVAKGPKANPPRHVFFILMESYDGWATLERYQSLGLSERLLDLGRRGIFSRKFLSASSGTMTSFAALVTGLADAGVVTNYQSSACRPYPSSINPIFQRLGMRTRMFLGGFFSWQRSDAFCLDQGFQELYAAPHIAKGQTANEWGPDDRDLFDFALRAVDPQTPSFNVIVTSSYHPPFSVDVYGRGFPHKTVPADLAKDFQADPDYLRVLGHLWYSDQMLGEFVEAAERKFPDALFVITGDHTSRQFLNKHPTLYEQLAVPFVMYGPSVLQNVFVPDDLVGSHHDIMPTVIELLAPRGFEYHAIGRDLLHPTRPAIGFGRDHIIGPDFIASRLPGGSCESLDGDRSAVTPPNLVSWQAEYQSWLGLAWWRICRGSAFPDLQPSSHAPQIANQRDAATR